ncbi:hypothetical protein TNCT_283911 [Trichonephila clavata]|uniref:Uncharacterized protein n=1 Tax=Trichonephila clavata TaxID=2740835 RepID=A0A8X6LLW0_TRICU|nr:hypothetical protein TNCT_283911 [Trichonephila clavata]
MISQHDESPDSTIYFNYIDCFSEIHVGHDRENDEWSTLQSTHRLFPLLSLLSWPTSAHLAQMSVSRYWKEPSEFGMYCRTRQRDTQPVTSIL